MPRRTYRCPSCGDKTGADILYGEPAWELVKDEVEQGLLVIEGCVIDSNDPERQCTRYGHQWRICLRLSNIEQRLEPPDYFRLEIHNWPAPP